MTLDTVARMTHEEFSIVDKKIESLRETTASKGNLKKTEVRILDAVDTVITASKDDLKKTEVRILQAVDTVITRFDRAEKEDAAHTHLHKRITDTLHNHDQRIKRVEVKM